MNLDAIQPFVAGLVRAAAPFSTVPDIAALPGKKCVLEDDGTYPKTPYREEMLSVRGLCITIWQVECASLEDSSKAGAVVTLLYVPIVIEENVKVNRAPGGTGITADAAIQSALIATCGKRPSVASTDILKAFDPPWDNLGTTGGVRKIIVNIGLTTVIAA